MTVTGFEAESVRDQWQAALAAYEMATRDLALDYDSDELTDFYTDVQTTAADALMDIPAPDAAAFALKVETFLKHDCSWDHEKRAALLSDARRLAEVG